MEITATEMEGFAPYAEWALETGMWDGSVVSWQNASQLREELDLKIARFFFSQDPNSLNFQQMAATFAAIGSIPEKRSVLIADLQELRLYVPPCNSTKPITNFWQKHKEELLVGISVIATVTAIALTVICASAIAAGILSEREITPNLPSPLVPVDRGVVIDGQYRSFQDLLQYGCVA